MKRETKLDLGKKLKASKLANLQIAIELKRTQLQVLSLQGTLINNEVARLQAELAEEEKSE